MDNVKELDEEIDFTNVKNKSIILGGKYKLVQKIGEGSFGRVYVALNDSGKYVAIKIESKLKQSRLQIEYVVYKYISKEKICKNIPKIYDYFDGDTYRALVMELLGPSLDDMFNKYNKRFKLSTVFMLAHQLIYTLYNFHRSSFIHRDIKLNNFLFDIQKQSIYIMDFGLSKQFYSKQKHINMTTNRSLIGTARYASINMHLGLEPSRRDDLESLGYMLIHLAKGILPWQGLKKEGVDPKDLIRDKKLSTSLDSLCKGLPRCFKEYISYCRNLTFEQTPDYKYLIDIFTQDSEDNNIPIELEWL